VRALNGLLAGASAEGAKASQAVRDLALGRTDNLHSVALAVARADLSFRMVLEMRNRLSDAYQEIMRMSV
jgi:flagellar hook-basal body complex protein FliE